MAGDVRRDSATCAGRCHAVVRLQPSDTITLYLHKLGTNHNWWLVAIDWCVAAEEGPALPPAAAAAAGPPGLST